jgi:hypothetical protein
MNETKMALRAERKSDYNGSYFLDSGGGSGICRPLTRILDQNKPLSRRFFELVNRLNKFFSISKAVLIKKDFSSDSLKMMTVWEQTRLREGVMLTIPPKNSLLYRIKKMRLIVNRSASGDIPPEYQGNFIESNILFDKATCSLAICPLFADNSLMGITCLTSPVPFAFELIERGDFDEIFKQLGEIMAEENISASQKV